MITQDIEKRVLERLSLADEVSKYGVITDNPGDEVWPFKAECVFPRISADGRYKEKVTVLLSKTKKTFLVDDEGRYCAGDALEFLHKALSLEPKWDVWDIVGQRSLFAYRLATRRHWNVWEG